MSSVQDIVFIRERNARNARIQHLLIRRRWRVQADAKRDVLPRLVFPVTIFFTLLLFIVAGGVEGAQAYYQGQLARLNGVTQHSLFQTTRIYDRNGTLLYELYDHQLDRGRRTYVNYTDIAPALLKATVAAEDRTFWSNSGVDYFSIVRAALSDLQKKSVVEGGSTITQQLIKNQFFQGQPRTFGVKGEEAVLATGMTQQYPKWKILEMYLNTVYYGDTDYGIEAAAQDYFGLKPVCDGQHCKPAVAQLSLGQASLLAGLPQSPTAYNPTLYKERALTRQQQVLQAMVEMKDITVEQKHEAQKEMKNFKFVPYSTTHPKLAPHFVNYIIDEVLVPLLGAENLRTGGYNIYTSLDLNLERKVEQIVYYNLYQRQYDPYSNAYGTLHDVHNVNNGAVVVMNPHTGEILAMDGSASTDPQLTTAQMQGEYNAAISPRQPGSAFKPFVYATAFQMGWYPAMIVPDHRTYYPDGSGKPYTPQNYDGTFHVGYPMTIRTALANSFNIPAITTMEYTGVRNVMNMAGRLGLDEVASKPINQVGVSMAIGAVEVSPLHMTAAYATFANNGVRMPITSILKITDSQNQPLYTLNRAAQRGEQVLRPEIAFMMSSMLSDKSARYHEFAPGNPLELSRPAAAKTGTTDSFRDNWTLGYTPHLAVGVWAGNSDNSKMNDVIGITGAGPIWHDVMEYASQYYNYPPDDFVPPPGVHQAQVSALTGLAPAFGEPTVSDWFIDGTVPTLQSARYYIPPLPRPAPVVTMTPVAPIVPTQPIPLAPAPCFVGNCTQGGQGVQGPQNGGGGPGTLPASMTPEPQEPGVQATPTQEYPNNYRYHH